MALSMAMMMMMLPPPRQSLLLHAVFHRMISVSQSLRPYHTV
jgi:hypothetical protein